MRRAAPAPRRPPVVSPYFIASAGNPIVSLYGTADIDMNAIVSTPGTLDEDQARAIASLSEKLHLPLSEVRHVYLKELARLRSQARIHSFLEALAVNSTRAVLRSGQRLQSRP